MRRMSRAVVRGFAAVILLVVFSTSIVARPREERPREPREKSDPIVKIIKRVIRSLGDGLVTPTP